LFDLYPRLKDTGFVPCNADGPGLLRNLDPDMALSIDPNWLNSPPSCPKEVPMYGSSPLISGYWGSLLL
jgi:hypothetical protein